MSRILRRPMFRGGPASSDGVGITSGLDTPKRGLVDGPGGYAGDLDAILKQQKDIYEQQQNYVQPKTSEDILKKYNKDIAAYDLSFMDPDSSGTGGYAQDLANTYYAKSTPEYKKKYLELEEAKAAQQKLIGEKLGFKFDQTLYGKNVVDNKKTNLLDNSQIDENNVLKPQDAEDFYNKYYKMLSKNLGPDQEELTRQKYLELAKFGLNLLKPTPAGVKPNLASSIAAAAEKPLEGYSNILTRESQAKQLPKQLAAQAALAEMAPGSLGKQINDLVSSGAAKNPKEAMELLMDKYTQAAARQKVEQETIKEHAADFSILKQFKGLSEPVLKNAGRYLLLHEKAGTRSSPSEIKSTSEPVKEEGRLYLDPINGKIVKYINGELLLPGERGYK
jgi:hypothetical protein